MQLIEIALVILDNKMFSVMHLQIQKSLPFRTRFAFEIFL